MVSAQTLLQPVFPLHHKSGTKPSPFALLLSKQILLHRQSSFLFLQYMQNLQFSLYHLSPFLISSYCFFVISPEAYLLFRIVNESGSFLLDWFALIGLTISQIISPQKSNIKINPNPIIPYPPIPKLPMKKRTTTTA